MIAMSLRRLILEVGREWGRIMGGRLEVLLGCPLRADPHCALPSQLCDTIISLLVCLLY